MQTAAFILHDRFPDGGEKRRSVRRHLFALVPEVAADELEGFSGRVHFLHDHRGRDRLDQIVLRLARLGERGFRTNVINGVVVLVEPAQVIALFLGPFSTGLRNDGHHALKDEKARVFGAKRAVIKARVVDQTCEVPFFVTRANPQWFIVADGPREFVFLNLDVARPAIDKELHTGAFPGAVVRDENVQPPVRSELVLGFDFEGIVRELVNQVDFEVSVAHKEVEAAVARFLLDLAQNRAVGLDLNPRSVAEGVGALERDERAQVNVRFAVKLEGLAEPAIGILRLVVTNKFRTVDGCVLDDRLFWLGLGLRAGLLRRRGLR